MKEVIQGNTITIDTRFYNADPSLGGVPTDPDAYLHTWDILNDVGHRVSGITLYHNSIWPPNPEYYLSIIDSGTDFRVNVYTDVARTVLVASTGALAYGVYVGQALVEVGGSDYQGTVDITFPGIGVGFETFEIEDIGPTTPTYQIRDQDNTLIMVDTLYPTRVAVGHYQMTYTVSSTATPGENWRVISRGKINNIDVYYTEYFRVIDATVATEEAAKIVTLSEVKTMLQITDTAQDTYYDSLILPASQACEEYLDAKYHIADNVEIFNGNGQMKMFFDGPGPLYSITSIEVRDGNVWTALLTTDYMFDAYFITLINDAVFELGQSNYRITYQYGVSRAPSQIRKGVCELIRYWNATKNRGGVLEDNIGAGLRTRYEELKADLPPVVLQLWSPYRRLV